MGTVVDRVPFGDSQIFSANFLTEHHILKLETVGHRLMSGDAVVMPRIP
jgi:hypothetical protein